MKKKQWMLLVVIAACAAAFVGFQAWDRAVTDRRAPSITMEENMITVSVYDPESALLQGVTAADSRDGDVTDSLLVESVGSVNEDGQVKVTYAAFDRAGNVAKASRTVQYSDYVPPRFTLDAPLAYAHGSSFDIIDHVGAVDLLDGDITHRVKVTSLADSAISAPGVYDIRLQVTNSLGDTETLIVQTEIYPSGTYNAQLTLTEYLVYVPQGAVFDPEDYLGVFTYGSNAVDLSGGVPGSCDLEISGRVNTQTPGLYTIEYLISRTAGSQVYTAYSRLVVVVEG